MRIYPLRYPGVFLDLQDQDAAFRLRCLLTHAEDALIDAAVALNLFEIGVNLPMPREYMSRTAFVYAHAFVLALNQAGQMIRVIAEQPGLAPSLKSMPDKFRTTFPTVVGLRDTLQHLEDRGRSLRKKTPLKLQPVMNKVFNAPGGVLAIDVLNGSVYGSTMGDGRFGEIDVSDATLGKLQALLQELLDTLPWKPGHARESPSPPLAAPEIPEWVRKGRDEV